MKTRNTFFLASFLLVAAIASHAQVLEPRPNDPVFANFLPLKAPQTTRLLLKKGDRLAICGDSITEQKMYSRLIEDYLVMCVPHFQVTVRQFGWSGERAPGFLARMTNDCLRFNPTIATTCYGMNDHAYRPYEEAIGQAYRTNSRAVIRAFKAHGTRVIHGAPGCVGKMPQWVKTATGTVEDLNLNLCNLRNIGVWLAQEEQIAFADVFWPMLKAGVEGQRRYGTNFAIAGSDGVHPGWAGQTVMAYAFLKAMGLDGEIGVFTVDLARRKMNVSKGHDVISQRDGVYQVRSSRYPFSYCLPKSAAPAGYPVCETDDATKDVSIRSATALIPFDQDLNRLMLVGKNAKAPRYEVSWGEQTKVFSSEDLARGINLAVEFPLTPFSEAFAKVDAAVAAKQAYETKQIKEVFHGPEGKADMQAAVNRTEFERMQLVEQIYNAFQPVAHVLRITALQ